MGIIIIQHAFVLKLGSNNFDKIILKPFTVAEMHIQNNS